MTELNVLIDLEVLSNDRFYSTLVIKELCKCCRAQKMARYSMCMHLCEA